MPKKKRTTEPRKEDRQSSEVLDHEMNKIMVRYCGGERHGCGGSFVSSGIREGKVLHVEDIIIEGKVLCIEDIIRAQQSPMQLRG